MTARPPSGQYPSDEGPGHAPAATGAPTGPAVPATFLPARTPTRTGPATAHRDESARPGGSADRSAPTTSPEPADGPRPSRAARVSYGSPPVPRAPRAGEEREA
ncbi:hypothetical protein M271_16690, partial [Streptomyces rapamycinicus NRRL 5491]